MKCVKPQVHATQLLSAVMITSPVFPSYSSDSHLSLLSLKHPSVSYTSPPVRKTTSPQWCHLWTLQARLPWRPPFSQHVIWWCCNPPDIPSSMVEILLFNSVFHDGVAPVSVSTLKPPLGAIGVLLLKPRASPIISVVYKTSSYTVIC